jgi:hypothetical protein
MVFSADDAERRQGCVRSRSGSLAVWSNDDRVRRHGPRVGAAVLSLLVLLLAPRRLLAAASGPSSKDGVRAFAEVQGQVADASGPLADATAGTALGYQVNLGVGLKALPLLFGVGLGVLSLGDFRADAFPSASFLDHAEVRHAELSLRLEPDFHYVRPFVDASVGIAALYLTAGWGKDSDDYQADTALARAVSVGLDLSPWERRRASGSVVLTIGYRAWESGALRYSVTTANGAATVGGPLRTQGAFVGLTLFGWS